MAEYNILDTSRNAFQRAENLKANIDLNKIINPGIYYQALSANAKSGVNYPVIQSGWLLVYAPIDNATTGIAQQYIAVNTTKQYFRTLLNGKWSEWAELYHSGNKPTANDVQALPTSGGNITGNITVTTDSEIRFCRNTDFAILGFKNLADNDPDSYFYFETGDNGNEYFKWRHRRVGTSEPTDWMTLKGDNLRIKGIHQVYHEGFKPSAKDLGALPCFSVLEQSNLNDVRDAGIYVQPADIHSLVVRNYPIQQAGTLIVTPGVYGIQQEYTSYHSHKKYVRNTAYDGGFLPWTEYCQTQDLLIGSPQPWPSATPPTGWLKCDGASFNKNHYPLLAKAYPSGVLPDLRGEFIRGWDAGRGIDNGRGLLIFQEHGIAYHNHTIVTAEAWNAETWAAFGIGNDHGGDAIVATDNIAGTNMNGATNGIFRHNYYATNIFGHSNETRPRNIAFLYIVRAA